jgi:hypothetical protein
MAIDYTLLNAIKSKFSSSTVLSADKASLISEMQSNMAIELENNFINEYEVKIGMEYFKKTITVNFTDTLTVVVKQEDYAQERTILCEVNDLATGDYVTITEDDTDYIYIVSLRPFRKSNYDSVFVSGCQYDTKILDADGKTVLNYPLSFQSNKSNPSVKEGYTSGVTENSSFEAYVKYDDITKRFVSNADDNKITRVLVNGLAYKIIGSDPASLKGLLILGLELDEITPDDNLDLGVADYYSNVVETSDDTITGDSDLWIGDTNTYSITTDSIVTWELTDDGVIATLLTSDTNGECTVICKSNTSLIGEIVTLTATLDTDVQYTKIITITSRI